MLTDVQEADPMPDETPRRRRRTYDDPDRTARARIRDAAIERFANEGVAAANLKDIAADAGVSTPLVIHHFGSKEGLRVACDEYVSSVINEQKSKAMKAAGARSLDPFQAVRDAYEGTPIVRYLAATLVEGSPHVDGLVDGLIEDAMGYMSAGIEDGVMTPTDNLRERVIVLSIWQMGALALHRQVERLLGIDLVDNSAGSALEWARVNSEILAKGVIDAGYYETFRHTLEAASRQRNKPAEHTEPTRERTREGEDREET